MNIELFTEPFMIRALLSGIGFALACGFLGVFLVLRRASMIGEGLAHFSFGMVGLALCLGWMPMVLAIPAAAVGALIVLNLSENGRRFGDAAIGMLSAIGVSAGLVLAKTGRGFVTDLYSYLFGDILTVSTPEMYLTLVISASVIVLLFLFSNELFAATFDPDYASVSGLRIKNLNRLLAVLTGLSVVIGIKVMGVMLVSSMIIFPAVTALETARGFRAVLMVAALTALVSVAGGVVLSSVLDWPTGATIVLFNAAIFTLVKIFRK